MNEIKTTAPTPQDWIDLVRENERLEEKLRAAVRLLSFNRYMSYMKASKQIDGEQNK